MKLNLENKTIDIKIANNFKDRFIGLMGKTNINYGMLFPKCNAIHTFFMKEAIDVIGLNNNNEILFIIKSLKPNKLFHMEHNLNDSNILELPNNSSNNFHIGETIKFEL